MPTFSLLYSPNQITEPPVHHWHDPPPTNTPGPSRASTWPGETWDLAESIYLQELTSRVMILERHIFLRKWDMKIAQNDFNNARSSFTLMQEYKQAFLKELWKFDRGEAERLQREEEIFLKGLEREGLLDDLDNSNC